jgi:hypothetical protein
LFDPRFLKKVTARFGLAGVPELVMNFRAVGSGSGGKAGWFPA